MRSVWLALSAALLAAGCASTPPEQDPVQIKLNDIDARLARVERSVANQVELSQHLDEVQAALRELRGRIEELEHSTELLAKQQRALYSDLDRRIAASGGPAASGTIAGAAGGTGGTGGASASATAGAGAAAAAGTSAGGSGEGAAASAGTDGAGGGTASEAHSGSSAPAAAAGSGPSSVEQAVYAQAFDALKAGSYSIAITGFRGFLVSYPASPLADSAQYWLGESYYVNRDYDSAAGAFRTMLKKWPDSRRAPDALLKLGYAQYQQKQYPAARATLEEVTRKYPGSDAAKLATDRLARIPAAVGQ